ncbi:MAG: carotenoid oxygenase family protein [Pseudomonadota bacterium]
MKPRGVNALKTLRRPHGFEPRAPEQGAIPEGLEGRLYRIGAGRYDQDGAPFGHWFDGEGLVTAVDFQNGAARIANRLIEPAGWGAPGYTNKGRFGMAPKGLWNRLRSLVDPSAYVNGANTALMEWEGRLFALFEGDRPTEIDPDTLATLGARDLGVIRRTFSAHPKRHPSTGAWINQGFRPPPVPMLDYYRLGADGAAERLASVRYGGAILMHDFAVTERFIVTVCPPLFLDLPAFLLKGRPLARALQWRPERGTEILVLPLSGDGPVRRLRAEPFLLTHVAQAWEEGDAILLQAIAADDASGVDWIGAVRAGVEALPVPAHTRLSDIRIDLATGAISRQPLFDAPCDFPIVAKASDAASRERPDQRPDGRPARFVYAAGFRDDARAYRDLVDVLIKVDLERGTLEKIDLGDGVFVSEALFAPRPGATEEDDGWLLSLNYDAGRDESFVAIHDARGRPEARARIPVGQPLPLSFHGLWRPRPRPTPGGVAPGPARR